jgi:hypothetical protein
MAITKPGAGNNDPYVAPSNMNAGNTFDARPDQWGQTPTIDSSTLPHTTLDELQSWDAGGPSTLGDGAHASTLDDPRK